MYHSPAGWLKFLLLLLVYSFVSYRTIKALRRGSGMGLFRNVLGHPIAFLLLLPGALPLFAVEAVTNRLQSSPRRRHALDAAEYIGNRESLVYHRKGCEYRDIMSYDKRVAFRDEAQARKQGYRPCAACRQSPPAKN